MYHIDSEVSLCIILRVRLLLCIILTVRLHLYILLTVRLLCVSY